ncbi:MAG: hypothetical protein HXY20_10565 [Acidobacteria bacterium]|nr:hypothetical protein [Acidobacteriota bacterium]
MRTACLLVLLVVIVGGALLAGDRLTGDAGAWQPIQLGSRLELMLDDYLIASLKDLEFVLHSPRSAEQVLTFESPWEGPYCINFRVLRDGDRYRMYYKSNPDALFEGEAQYTCYAESRDGVCWTKPTLGLVSYKSSTANNPVWRGQTARNLSPSSTGIPAPRRGNAIATWAGASASAGCTLSRLGMGRAAAASAFRDAGLRSLLAAVSMASSAPSRGSVHVCRATVR